jgi:hypothetical protein
MSQTSVIALNQPFRLIDCKVVDLTPKVAAQFAAMPAMLTERDLDQGRLDKLKARILSGQAIPFNWAIAVLPNGEERRVNGQHSSHTLVNLDGAFPPGLQAQISRFEVKEERDLAILFRQFDARMSARTPLDISGVYQMLSPALRKVTKRAAKRALEGIVWYMRHILGGAGKGHPVPQGEEIFDLFNEAEYHAFIQMAGTLPVNKTKEFIPPVMGAMYGTHERDAQKATNFWNEVANAWGSPGPEDDPALVLYAFLDAAKEAVGEKKPKQLAVYAACVIAWNAYCNGKPLSKIRAFDPKKHTIPDIE